MDECFFKWKYNCDKDKELKEVGPARISTIIRFSKQYGDDIYIEIERKLKENADLTLKCHRDCVSTYTSTQHLRRHKRKASASDHDPSSRQSKRPRRSLAPAFCFQEHCLFCGEECLVEKDTRHPDRWRRASLCRTATRPDHKSFKESILDVCTRRSDDAAQKVRIRVEGALSDLHAADARYHVDCMTAFMSPRSVAAAVSHNEGENESNTDEIFESVIAEMEQNKERPWNSIEIFQLYQKHGGQDLTKHFLFSKVKHRLGEDIAVLSSSGLASLIVFKKSASALLHLVNDREDDDQEMVMERLAATIVKEVKQIEVVDKSRYKTRITTEDASLSTSPTLLDLLAKISLKLKYTLPAFLIGNIITSILTNHPTDLQIALGNLMRDCKSLVNDMYKFKVTCSYDEVLRFKKSAAKAASRDIKLSGIQEGGDGLIQTVVDNFDADISSQNVKLTTHSLAVVIAQPTTSTNVNQDNKETIPRISKAEMSEASEYEIEIQRYQGPKKVEMPDQFSKKSVLPLKVLCSSIVSQRRAKELDFAFMNEITNNSDLPEFNGFNTMVARDQGQGLKPKTKAVYLPLIDMPPSDPDTMMTALEEAKQLTKERGQNKVVFTCDQQLYKIAVDIKWTYPDQFSDVTLRLGGMHMLMSFVGAIGSLMDGSGLSDVLSSTFAGVAKMLSGKKFPQNVRALRIVTEELLREIVNREDIKTMAETLSYLDEVASKSKTSKLWVDCFIKAVFIIMIYVRAEREGDWPLHLYAVEQMLPYFFASGHINYARYGLYYLRSVQSLEGDELSRFMKGDHVMHHVPGIWNGIWSDMFIETTFMRYGHGPGGIIGITLKPETLKTWALSLHICSRLEQDTKDLASNEEASKQIQHKEESTWRINADRADRESIQKKLELCIKPLDPTSHSSSIVNIVSGRLADETVNVHEALKIGTQQMKDFEKGWPKSFNSTISKRVTTIKDSKKHIKIGNKKVYDTTVIYSRVIGLQASSRDIDIKNVLSHELAPVPTSMFHDSGEMRLCKSKSDLKNRLAIESSLRCASTNVKATVLDGSAVLWVIHWPAKGTVLDFVQNFEIYLEKRLQDGDVYLVFDRYRDYSTKTVTRQARECEASRPYQLAESTSLPSQKAILTVTSNKQQLTKIICNNIVNDGSFISRNTFINKLVITGSNDAPTEIFKGVVIQRHDISTTHEEADNIIVQQAIMCAKETSDAIMVIADDTDVFILLLYHYQQEKLKCKMLMTSPIHNRSVIDIKATVQAHLSIISCLPAAHAISGCDTVPCYFGIGKGTVLRNLIALPNMLSLLGCLDASMEDVVGQSAKFIGACYSAKSKSDEEAMSDLRYKIWLSKFGKGSATAPKLQTLPPSTEAFAENVKRAHLQTAIWKSAVLFHPPNVDPEEYGYLKIESSKTLQPTTVPDGIPLAPADVMKLIKCNCGGDSPCRTMRCSCNKSRLPCTLFCNCNACADCLNELNNTVQENDDD